MISVLAWFRDGGIFMFILLALALAVGPAVVAVTATAWFVRGPAARGLAFFALILAATPAGCGAVGTWRERAVVHGAIALATPEQGEVLRELALPDTLHPLELGGAVSLVLGLVAVAALRRAYSPHRTGQGTVASE